GRDRVRVGPGHKTASAFVTRVRIFRNELGEAFVQPTGDAIVVKAMQNEMNDLVSQKIVAEFICRILLNKETAGRMNSTTPGLEFAESLKLLPFFRALKNVNVRFDVAGGLLALQLFRDNAIVKFRFNRNGRGHVTVNEMINEMLGLGVFPLLRVNRERFLADRIRIALTQVRKFN